ncbi:MAG: RluA family pseudouridine synthase [Cyanobacteria bacterium P01_H01_bin.153]
MNQGWTYRDRVPAEAAGQSLLDYYAQRYRHSTRQEWQKRIQEGLITVEGRPSGSAQRLRAGQQLAYHRPPWQEPEVPLEFDVLYEDGDVLAIAKPSGLPVLPGGQFLEHTLLHQLKRQYPQRTPIPVHRLGRGTSGVMLLARSAVARADLSRQLRQNSQTSAPDFQLTKTYRALIGPHSLPDAFEITLPIGPVVYPGLGTVHAATPGGKWAYSQVRVIDRGAAQSIIEVSIKTGRPHQIRIHLAAAGYPLLGEPLYTVGGVPRMVSEHAHLPVPSDLGYWLHAYQLRFKHPMTQAMVTVICPPPPCLQAKASTLGR